MTENQAWQPKVQGNRFDQYLPPSEQPTYYVDIPPNADLSFAGSALPNNIEPMGIIRGEGKAFQNLSRKHAPWWAILTGWLVLGLPGLFVLGIALALAISQMQALLTSVMTAQGWNAIAANAVLFILGVVLMAFGSLSLAIPVRSTWAKIKRQRVHRPHPSATRRGESSR